MNLTDLAPFKPSDAQFHELVQSHGSPEVAGLASTLRDYADGEANARSTQQLKAIPKSLARNPFALVDDERGLFGGSILRIMFLQSSNLYITWIYQLGGYGYWEVRSFDLVRCTAEQRRWLQARYAALNKRVIEEASREATDPFATDSPTLLVQGLVSEGQVRARETTETAHDLKLLNARLGRALFTGFSIQNVRTGPFQYQVDEKRWAATPESYKHDLVTKRGALYNESRRIYRKYHGGRIHFSDSSDGLTFRIVNAHNVPVGLNYARLSGSD